MTRHFKVLHPEYYPKFKCIGGECEENCCMDGWNIFVDRKSYQKLRAIKDPAFAGVVAQNLKRIRGNDAGESKYATLLLDETGSCSFLTQDGFCEIQQKYGAGYLCHTCRVYPRYSSFNIGDRIEFSLMMSCPEAARIALLPDNPMRFQLSGFDMDPRDMLLAMPSFALATQGAKTEAFVPYHFIIREACIDILQYRGTAINNRLFIIGMMLDKLEKSGGEAVPETLSFFTRGTLSGQFDGITDTFHENEELRGNMEALLFLPILDVKNNKSFARLVELFFTLGIEDEGDDGEIRHTVQIRTLFEHMNACVDKHWKPFLENYHFLLENYLVNYVFSAVFPFAFQIELTLYEHFIVLAEQYVILQMLLCALAGEDGITKEHFISVISTFSRFSQHSKGPVNVVGSFKQNELDSLAHMSFLLRR